MHSQETKNLTPKDSQSDLVNIEGCFPTSIVSPLQKYMGSQGENFLCDFSPDESLSDSPCYSRIDDTFLYNNKCFDSFNLTSQIVTRNLVSSGFNVISDDGYDLAPAPSCDQYLEAKQETDWGETMMTEDG